MNIFVVDSDPVIAASFLCDKHVHKMLSESCQLLSTSHNICGNAVTPLKPTHVTNPCNKWLLQSSGNYQWLYEHYIALIDEYNKRFLHNHDYIIYKDSLSECSEYIPDKGITKFVQNMPIKYRQEDVVQAYRDYYCNEKLHFSRWTEPSRVPDWVREFIEIKKLRYFIGIKV